MNKGSPRKSNKLTPQTRAFLRASFKAFDGHPYDRKFFFAALAKRTDVPQPSITKFYYNDRRRNPHFYDDIRRQKSKHRPPVDEEEEEDENRPVSNVSEVQPPPLPRVDGMKEEEMAAVNLLLSIRYLLQSQNHNDGRCPPPQFFHRPEVPGPRPMMRPDHIAF